MKDEVKKISKADELKAKVLKLVEGEGWYIKIGSLRRKAKIMFGKAMNEKVLKKYLDILVQEGKLDQEEHYGDNIYCESKAIIKERQKLTWDERQEIHNSRFYNIKDDFLRKQKFVCPGCKKKTLIYDGRGHRNCLEFACETKSCSYYRTTYSTKITADRIKDQLKGLW